MIYKGGFFLDSKEKLVKELQKLKREMNLLLIRGVVTLRAGGAWAHPLFGPGKGKHMVGPPTFDFGPLLIGPLTLRNVTTSLWQHTSLRVPNPKMEFLHYFHLGIPEFNRAKKWGTLQE